MFVALHYQCSIHRLTNVSKGGLHLKHSKPKVMLTGAVRDGMLVYTFFNHNVQIFDFKPFQRSHLNFLALPYVKNQASNKLFKEALEGHNKP